MKKLDTNAFSKELEADRMEAHGTSDMALIAERNYKKFKRAWDLGHEDYVKEAQNFDDFYRGNQWNPDDKARLEASHRPALTVNMILPTINTVIGEQSLSQTEFMFKPKRTGKEEVAQALTKLWLHISDDQNYSAVEAQVFADGLIQDRGYFDIRINFDDHINGEVQITAEDPTEIVLDPDAKNYDPKYWNIIQKTFTMTLDEIKGTYGTKAATKLAAIAEIGGSLGPDSIKYYDRTFSTDDQYDVDTQVDEDLKRGIKSVRIVESQFIKHTQVKVFVDAETGDTREIPATWDDLKIQQFRETFNLLVHQKTVKRVRWTVSADRVLLHDAWSPYKTFTIIPFFPYFRRGFPFGMVRNLINPQEILNKVSSQELHVINTTANSGWAVEAGSLTNMTTDDLETRGAQTGLVMEYKRGSAAPEKIQANTIPTGLDKIGLKAVDNVKQISGVSDSMTGQEKAEVSGIALESKQMRGKVQIQVPASHLDQSRKLVALKTLDLVQQFYTDPRIFRITDYRKGDVQEDVIVNQPDDEGGVFNNLTIGEYDVTVSSMPSRDSFEDAQFGEMMTMRNVGVIIPDDEVIRRSHLYDKGPIADKVASMQGTNEPTDAEMAEAERQAQVQAALDQLQVAKLEAEVGKLTAEAELAAAKAGDTQNSDNMELAELEAELQKTREELDLRMQLARISAANKTSIASIQGYGKIAEKQLSGATQLQAAKIAAQNKASSPTLKKTGN